MNDKKLVQISAEEATRLVNDGKDQTDWEKVASRNEDELDAAAADEGEFDWTRATIVLPPNKQQLTMRFDLDVIEWFRAQGEGYQTRMNQVLRRYVDAQKK